MEKHSTDVPVIGCSSSNGDQFSSSLSGNEVEPEVTSLAVAADPDASLRDESSSLSDSEDLSVGSEGEGQLVVGDQPQMCSLFDVVERVLAATPAPEASFDVPRGMSEHDPLIKHTTRRSLCGILHWDVKECKIPDRDPSLEMTPRVYKARALLGYKVRSPEELPLQQGDIVTITAVSPDNWGVVSHGERVGVVPLCFLMPIWRKYVRAPYRCVVSKVCPPDAGGVWTFPLATKFLLEELVEGNYCKVRSKASDEYGAVHTVRVLHPRRACVRIAIDAERNGVDGRPTLTMEKVLGVFVCAGPNVDPSKLIPLYRVVVGMSDARNDVRIRAEFYDDVDRKILRGSRGRVVFSIIVDVLLSQLTMPLRFVHPFVVDILERRSEFIQPPVNLESRASQRFLSGYVAILAEAPSHNVRMHKLRVTKQLRFNRYRPRQLETVIHGGA